MKNKVYLVGGGPGDPALITLKAMDAIKAADVIIYDRLINDQLLAYSQNTCELIYAGKKANNHHLQQDEINQLLIEKAAEGKTVVRLKGGDPYVFGRGGEEGIALSNAGIDFEVVPGITSAIAGLNYAGIPITHRGVATSFHVMTGHFKKGSTKTLDFKTLSQLDGTLVFLMGIGNLENITKGFIEEEMDPNTPVAVIQWATYSQQRSAVGTLETIVDLVDERTIGTPGIIVIGEVVNLREQLNYFEQLPLFNQTVGITRPLKQNKGLIQAVRALGGQPVEIPSINIKKINEATLKTAIETLAQYSWLIFTSVNAVEIFFETLFEMSLDVRVLGDINNAVVGNSTREKLKTYGINADLVPREFTGEALGNALVKQLTVDDTILIPRSVKGKEKLTTILNQKAKVTDLPIYDLAQPTVDEALLEEPLDYVLFTSPSTFNNFYSRVSKDYFDHSKIISIGPITSKAIEKKSVKVYKEAKKHTIQGLIDCLRGEINDID